MSGTAVSFASLDFTKQGPVGADSIQIRLRGKYAAEIPMPALASGGTGNAATRVLLARARGMCTGQVQPSPSHPAGSPEYGPDAELAVAAECILLIP